MPLKSVQCIFSARGGFRQMHKVIFLKHVEVDKTLANPHRCGFSTGMSWHLEINPRRRSASKKWELTNGHSNRQTKKGCCCSHRRFPSQASFHSSVKVSHQRWPTSRARLKPRDKALLVRQPSKNGLFSLNLIKSWFQMIPWFNIPIIPRPKTSPGLSKYLDHFSAPMMCWRICASDVAYAVLPQSRNLTTRPWLRR